MLTSGRNTRPKSLKGGRWW